MAEVTDPNGVQWSVRRRLWYGTSALGEAASGADPFGIALGLVLGGWPFWFIAHWLGLRWGVVIERDGEKVHEEWVRGWLKSRRRIQELTESATVGMLQRSLPAPPAADQA